MFDRATWKSWMGQSYRVLSDYNISYVRAYITAD